MQPYYQDDHVTIYHGDCLEVDAWLAADVMVTDPPYGIKWTNNGISRTSNSDRSRRDYNGKNRAEVRIAGDETTEVRDVALRLWGGRPAVVFGSLLIAPPLHTRHVAVYVKPSDSGAMSGLAHLRRDVEAIYLLGQTEEWKRQPSEGPPRSAIPQSKRPPSKWRSSAFVTSWRRAGSVHGLAATSGHPHAKPTDVLRDLISLHSGVVADPFMGSGSTLVAAKELGRRAIGVELDEAYCERAATRLSELTLSFGAAERAG